MKCAGSVGEGDEDLKRYAAEGTFAHSIAAKCLNENLKASGFFGMKDTVDGFSIECDQQMVDGVQTYLDAVDEDMLPGDQMWVEMSVHEELKSIDKDMGGTADYARYRRSTEELLVADFKYGAGVFVDVVDNEQLESYALGVLLKLQRQGFKIKQVRVMVCQPRHWQGEPVREQVFSAIKLLDFAADLAEAAPLTRLPNPPLVAGDHCKFFCPKARTCTELEKHQNALVTVNLDAVAVEQVAVLLASVPLVKARLKAIEEHAYTLAARGVAIPGWHLVAKLARRQWKREGDVVEWAQTQSIDPYAPRDVLSPAQLEEKIKAAAPRGKKKEAAAVLEQFVERVSSGTVLVPITDERPAVSARITAKDFSAAPAVAAPVALF
jgi:hypothetical protein